MNSIPIKRWWLRFDAVNKLTTAVFRHLLNYNGQLIMIRASLSPGFVAIWRTVGRINPFQRTVFVDQEHLVFHDDNSIFTKNAGHNPSEVLA